MKTMKYLAWLLAAVGFCCPVVGGATSLVQAQNCFENGLSIGVCTTGVNGLSIAGSCTLFESLIFSPTKRAGMKKWDVWVTRLLARKLRRIA
ncbi:MAG: hypothetical protein NTZ79_11255 [Proteobacteria bacterium]|nr:hypothetical protein [Pseudomonadota bacterium]